MSDYVESGASGMKDGIQMREILVTSSGWRHMERAESDRAVKRNLRGWDTHRPPFDEDDIVSIEVHGSPYKEYEALFRVEVAMGHRVVSKFANAHRDCAIAEVSHLALIPDDEGWTLQCPCGATEKLAAASLPSDMDSA